MQQISFVILHYKVEESTVQCVENLLRQNYSNYKIIIVDNFSNNGSIEHIRNRYLGSCIVNIIALERNYGFAKGNDIGYLFAKFKYNADYIVVMNNDVMIEDRDFCVKLLAISEKNDVGIIGPDIVNLSGIHQNPFMNCITKKRELTKTMWIIKLKLLFAPFLYWKKQSPKRDEVASPFIKDELKNIPLHGSCLIFTRNFIDTFNYAFYPDTFLYAEEDILFCLSQKRGIVSLYCPSIYVRHIEDVSTNSVHMSRKDKKTFMLKNSLASLKILQKI